MNTYSEPLNELAAIVGRHAPTDGTFDSAIAGARCIRISTPHRHLPDLSESALFQHFKAVTAVSPLQYLKRLRLTTARQMMLLEPVSAASAAYRVGYQSPSQFSRDYARMFGAPPLRDIKSIK